MWEAMASTIRKHISLPAAEDRRLQEIARTRGQSVAALIRDAIGRHLEQEDAQDAAWDRLKVMVEALPSRGSAEDRFDRSEACADSVDKFDGDH
jgi:predicted transcriptional regulator